MMENKVVLKFDYLPCVNYAMVANGIGCCKTLIVENHDTRDWQHLVVTLKGTYIVESTAHVDSLGIGSAVQLRMVEIKPDINALSTTTETIGTSFTLTVADDEEELFRADYPISLLAYNQWSGTTIMPELIAAYVVPNHPALSRVLVNTGRQLEQLTGSSSLDEYQTQNRNRVRQQVAALYEALRQEGIVYCAPPANFEKFGQRLRLADQVLAEKLGTCVDTTLLMASCLEQIGINPIIVILQGHALVGAWLTPTVHQQMVCDDASYLLKEMADGNNNVVLVETTAITQSAAVSFEDAVETAARKVRDDNSFVHFVDVRRCRLGNVRPIPQRVQKDGAWTFENEGVVHENATSYINSLNHYDLRMDEPNVTLTKQLLWERKLLDFSLRNNLLNTRLGKRVVPFISFGIDRLEDHLQNGEDYQITPCPSTRMEPSQHGMFDSAHQATQHQALVTELINDNKIVSYLTEKELQDGLKYIYRTARTAIEENGANSLFLTLGMLKWYETTKSEQPRFAPILLLPVDIIRRAGNNYVVRKRDEDIMLNITLTELLKQNFNIKLDALKQLPKDASGVDVKLIFTAIRRAIIEQKKWDVLEESMLGLFSFNKFVMWNDIHTNSARLEENSVISTLTGKSAGQDDTDDTIDARNTDKVNVPRDFCIPLDVDSSQMEAVVESGRGKSFILHGPPGTGKSQTITNMIANALFQGKRVLFVAEKMAALSVVQSRLEKIGLAPFCLELHSNKVTKKHFLEQMDMVLNARKLKSPEAYQGTSDELFRERQELIAYMEALHTRGSSGLSLYDCITEYLQNEGDELEGYTFPASQQSAAFIDKCLSQIDSAETVVGLVGSPRGHALAGLEPIDNKTATLDEIRQLLTDFGALWPKYGEQRNSFGNTTPFTLTAADDVKWLERLSACIDRSTQLECPLDGIMNIDVDSERRRWNEIQQKWFLPRFFAKRSYQKELRQYGNIAVDDAEQLFTLVDDVDALLASYAKKKGERYSDCRKRFIGSMDGGWKAFRQDFKDGADALLGTFRQLESLVGRLGRLTASQPTVDGTATNVERWMANYASVKDWCHWVDKKRELTTLGLQPVVQMIESEGCRPAAAISAYVKGLYHQMITAAIDDSQQLRKFNGLLFRKQIDKYKENTQRFQELSKAELYARLVNRIPSAATASVDGSEVSILKRNIANGGRGTSIRTIIDSIPTLLPRLCPCMLMSPLSVAQFIDLASEKFDLVIFDEASQMPTSEAVGAIARGKALIVVGDSKQMPPTSFFTSSQVDEDEADIDDMESILDDCRTLSMREYYLSWHYRSKHESLIAFSNSQYYDNRLLTFPSVDDQDVKVRLVKVDGKYDKGRTRSNPEEAQAIAHEVMRRLADPELSRLSIGIVSFSKVQQNLIEDILSEELDRHPDLKDIALGGQEPLFIKNLENVQGDERDVILFSVGYGPDKFGKVSMNFGPLNNAGGERRLNVAVSRARYEMVVYSTLSSSQIDLKRSNAKGVEGLKAFLEYAENGRLPMTATQAEAGSVSNVLIEQICQAIRELGYTVTAGVGRSNFKVDIAVSAKDNPERYILGILCDGKSYYATKTTRDREIVQPNVLQMLHWRTLRIYSIDWYENRERVISQIREALSEAESARPAPLKPEAPKPSYAFSVESAKPSETVEEAVRNAHQRPYQEAQLPPPPVDKQNYNPERVYNRDTIRRILKVEQPVNDGYLCKRLARYFGFGHAGANIQRAVELAAANFYREPLLNGSGFTLWLDRESADACDFYRSPSQRTIADIPDREMMSVIREIVAEEFSLPAERIASIAAKKLGFASSGAKISEAVNALITVLERQSVITVHNGLVSLTESIS